MCMKNVNVNCFVCKNVVKDGEVPSFIGITNILAGEKCENEICVDNFNIVVLANIIQARDEEELFVNYECSMRITSHAGKTAEIARFKLAENAVHIEKEEGIVCRNFAYNQFFIPLKDYKFPDGEGKYILNLLIRRREGEMSNAKVENDTQFMMPLYIRDIENISCNE